MSSLRAVAERAGVSIKTVSNVVNELPTVTPSIRERVKQAIAELNYQPNLAARNLRRGRTGVIGFAVTRIDNAYFSELADHVVTRAKELHMDVLIHQTNGIAERERLLLSGGLNSLMDGLILSPSRLSSQDLVDLTGKTPIVLLGEHLRLESLPYVGIDNESAGRAAVEELLTVGSRNIVTLGVSETTDFPDAAHQRWEGARAAAQAQGPECSLFPVPFTSLNQEGGYQHMSDFIRAGNRFDGVFAYNDAVAIGAIRALHDAGLRVPSDAAVVGIDDIADSRYMIPSVSTVAPDIATIARLAVDSLQRSIQEGQSENRMHHFVDFHLQARESTRGAMTKKITLS